MVAWYTTAWFDRYVKCQGDAALQAQTPTAACSPTAGATTPRRARSTPMATRTCTRFYYRSRYDFHVPGDGEVTCDDMRAGCPTMAPDNQPPNYDYFKDATTPDGR